MAIDNQFRINELISSGSKAIVSKDVETGKHTFVTNADTIVLSKSEGGDAPYTHIRGERDGEQVGRIEKPKYDEEQLIKSVDVEVDELIGKPKKPKPDVVPRPVYEDLRRLYEQALADLAEANERIAELESEIQSLNAEIEALLIENDSLKIQKASADNEAQSSTQRYSDLLKDFSNSIIKGTRDGIERVSLTAQVQGLQAQKEALRQLLVQTQSQLSGAQAESTAAASGLTPGKDNEFFYKVESVTKAAKDADMAEIVAQHKKDLEEKSAELEAMRESKRVFSDRGRAGDLTPFAKDLMGAHILGVITGKGWDTDFAKDTLQKAGVTYTATTSAGIDVTVSQTIEQEIMNELKIARLFREIPVNGGATVLPIQPDSDPAEWTSTGADISLQNKGGSGNNFASSQVILNAYRLISITAIDNNTDEQVLVNLMPMLTDAIARSHARAVESMILNGNGTINGLAGEANSAAFDYDLSGNGTAPHTNKLTSANLLDLRQSMGKYGMNPSDVVYIVSQQGYFDLLDDAAFQTLDEVGSDLALRITGTLGAVYGSAVVPSEEMAMTAGNEAAFAVNTRNYVIPRLRGVTVEQDYEVRAQRRVLVASQSLGFEELVAASGGDKPSIKITNVA